MKHRFFIFTIAFIVIVSIVFTAIGYFKKGSNIAEIYSNDTLIQSVDLSTVRESYEIPIEKDGKKNTILVENGKISMLSANCPDKLCVEQGYIENGVYPIVCLPNNVVIKIVSSEKSDTDAVSR